MKIAQVNIGKEQNKRGLPIRVITNLFRGLLPAPASTLLSRLNLSTLLRPNFELDWAIRTWSVVLRVVFVVPPVSHRLRIDFGSDVILLRRSKIRAEVEVRVAGTPSTCCCMHLPVLVRAARSLGKTIRAVQIQDGYWVPRFRISTLFLYWHAF